MMEQPSNVSGPVQTAYQGQLTILTATIGSNYSGKW